MRAASDVTADTPTPKHAARCNGCPVSVSGYTCSCSVALLLGLGRGGVIPTPSAFLLTKRLDVSCVVCLNANNHAQKILHTLTTGAMDPSPPPGSALNCLSRTCDEFASLNVKSRRRNVDKSLSKRRTKRNSLCTSKLIVPRDSRDDCIMICRKNRVDTTSRTHRPKLLAVLTARRTSTRVQPFIYL